MNPDQRSKDLAGQHGQVLPLLAILMLALLVMLGLGVDLGFAYVTKANLSKSVDAACLTGMLNLYQGQARAETIALSSFGLNYGSGGRNHSSPSVTVSFSTDASNNTLLSVSATATIDTYFIRVLPQFKTLSVHATAQSTRANLIMTLVLDRSGSMSGNGGSAALPPDASTFIDFFDDTNDHVAMASFASNSKVDVAIGTGFKSRIHAALGSMVFSGGTFAQGGLALAQTQNNSVAVVPGENVVKIAVFFTDGLANIIQDTLNCGGVPSERNFGGYDTGNSVAFFDPNTGAQGCSTSGGVPSCCAGVSTFSSAIDGRLYSFTRTSVTRDAGYRTTQTASAMRAQKMVIYCIGLGNNVNRDFLKQIANDPTASTFDATQPSGEAVFAPTAADLQGVFQTIAAKILLRLVH